MEQTLSILERIAVALEEQNRQNQEWMELQKQWREEGDPVGNRIIALHEKAIEDQRVVMEDMARRQNDYLEAGHKAYLESLKVREQKE